VKTILKKYIVIIISILLFASFPIVLSDYTSETFGGEVTVEDPPGTYQYTTSTFGGSVEVFDDSWVNRPPSFSGQLPTGTGISLTPTANVTINDQDGNTTTIDWYNSTDNISWIHFAHFENHEANTSNSTTCSFADAYSTKYYLKVTANDSHPNGNITKYWNFTTRNPINSAYVKNQFGGQVEIRGNAPIINEVSPTNGSTTVVLYPTLAINISEPQGQNFNITWTTNATDWTAYNSSCINGTYTQEVSWANTSNTTYWFTVSINNTDNEWTNETYHFTTYQYNWSSSAVWKIGKTSQEDIDLDMDVDNSDLQSLFNYYLQTSGLGENDINEDGIVDYLDRSLIQNRLGETYG